MISKFALGLSILSAGFSAYAVWGAQESAKDFRVQVAANRALRDRITDLEAGRASRPESTPVADEPGAPTPPPLIPGATLASRPLVEPTISALERRLVELEKKEKEASEQIAKWRGVGADGAPVAAQTMEAPGNGPEFYNTVDDAAKHLALSPSQKAEFERTVEDSKREIEQLKKLPDETGKTWSDAEKDVMKIEGGSFSLDLTAMQKVREKVIPGRNESFGAAERRITDGAKKRLRDALTADQQTKFDKAAMPGLVGGGDGMGGFGNIFFSTSFGGNDAPPEPEKAR